MESPSAFAGQTVTVFGAAAGWGKKFARTIEPHAERVIRVDPKLEEQGVDPRSAIRAADSLLFAVTPDEQINSIVSQHALDLHQSQLILECSTTKRKIAETLHWLDRRGLSVCSIHPMARADLPSRGQNMLIMPVGIHGEATRPQAREIASLLEMLPVESIRFEQHSRVMAVVQGLDHALQRAKIRVLVRSLRDVGLPLEAIEAIASANFRINALGTARVGIQRPGVSANIIREAQDAPETRRVLQFLQEALEEISSADGDALTAQFQTDVDALDPDQSWRRRMLLRTNSVLEQMANLGIKGMRIYSTKNVPGTLEQIAGIFHRNGINITAITSHNLEPEEDRTGVTFQFGIDEKSVFDMQQLEADLAAIGVSIENAPE